MSFDTIFQGLSVSGAGLAAERVRLDTISRNIANANVVGPQGEEPYRRKEVVFESVLDEADARSSGGVVGGVRVAGVVDDVTSPLIEIHDPSHPMADPKTGIVRYPNVNSVYEMVDLMSASRAYEANLRAMTTYREMVRQSIRLLEG